MEHLIKDILDTKRMLAEEAIRKCGFWDEYIEYKEKFGSAPVDAYEKFVTFIRFDETGYRLEKNCVK